ncbi:uncharacterized protein isoform X2 [Leptinotarsa decemlineata]|uniref:uncharacterized protein isoform X2 n=1 Tax=Leptinotarsa decemlineata TaxID=7539 RepID=UPI003D306A21
MAPSNHPRIRFPRLQLQTTPNHRRTESCADILRSLYQCEFVFIRIMLLRFGKYILFGSFVIMGKIKGRLGVAEGKRLFASEKRRSRRNVGKKSLMTSDNISDDVQSMCSKYLSAVASPVQNVETTDKITQRSCIGISLQGRRLTDIGYLFISAISRNI